MKSSLGDKGTERPEATESTRAGTSVASPTEFEDVLEFEEMLETSEATVESRLTELSLSQMTTAVAVVFFAPTSIKPISGVEQGVILQLRPEMKS